MNTPYSRSGFIVLLAMLGCLIPVTWIKIRQDDKKLQTTVAPSVDHLPPVLSRQQEETTFEKIVAYWRMKFPNRKFGAVNYYDSNGPNGAWCHILVPLEIEPLYKCRFSEEFFQDQLHDKDNLHHTIAGDLYLLMHHPLHHRRPPFDSYPLNDRAETVKLVEYVVDTDKERKP